MNIQVKYTSENFTFQLYPNFFSRKVIVSYQDVRTNVDCSWLQNTALSICHGQGQTVIQNPQAIHDLYLFYFTV